MNMFKRNKQNSLELTVANRTVIRVLVLTIVSLILFSALQKATHALTLLFISLFLAVALNQPVKAIANRLPGKRRGSRTTAVGLSFLIVVIFITGFIVSIVPPLVKQTSNFIEAAPDIVQKVRSEDSSLGRFVRKYNLEDQVQKVSNELSDRLGNVGSTAVGGLSRISSSIFSTLTILVLTYMMLIEAPAWGHYAKRLIPDSKESHYNKNLKAMYKVVTGFVNGQVTLAALAAVLMLIPLFAFGVVYPIALMVIVFICGLIPMVGHTIGAAIVSTVALFTSPVSAIGVLVYYVIYQQIENYVIQPKIQSNSTNMSPLTVFSSVIIGVSFNGLLGGLVAIPVAGCIKVLLIDYLETRELIDRV